jgi:hypothetical protein
VPSDRVVRQTAVLVNKTLGRHVSFCPVPDQTGAGIHRLPGCQVAARLTRIEKRILLGTLAALSSTGDGAGGADGRTGLGAHVQLDNLKLT